MGWAMSTTTGPEPQEERDIEVPRVDVVLYHDVQFHFNGWVGTHECRGPVFEFEDAKHKRKIWVDVNGSFVCDG